MIRANKINIWLIDWEILFISNIRKIVIVWRISVNYNLFITLLKQMKKKKRERREERVWFWIFLILLLSSLWVGKCVSVFSHLSLLHRLSQFIHPFNRIRSKTILSYTLSLFFSVLSPIKMRIFINYFLFQLINYQCCVFRSSCTECKHMGFS